MADLLAISHEIQAGSQFTGAAPSTAYSDAEGVRWFAADTVGGLFDLGDLYHMIIKRVHIQLGGQSSWTLSMTDGVRSIVVAEGTAETHVDEVDLAIVPKGWNLKLVTAGATQAMQAIVWFQRSPIV
jgi:hypothetical protein